jgi:hypothetical protein
MTHRAKWGGHQALAGANWARWLGSLIRLGWSRDDLAQVILASHALNIIGIITTLVYQSTSTY